MALRPRRDGGCGSITELKTTTTTTTEGILQQKHHWQTRSEGEQIFFKCELNAKLGRTGNLFLCLLLLSTIAMNQVELMFRDITQTVSTIRRWRIGTQGGVGWLVMGHGPLFLFTDSCVAYCWILIKGQTNGQYHKLREMRWRGG